MPGFVGVQLVTVRMRQIRMMEETPEGVLGNVPTVMGLRYDGKSFRDEHKIFVIGQWSFVIGHLDGK